MIRTMNPYASARTAEIMSRYRPIAPKPDNQNPNNPLPETENSTVPTGIRNSPYLRSVWANLQARPTRTRKRGRTAAFAPPSVKRARASPQGVISPPPPAFRLVSAPPPMHGLVPVTCCLDTAVANLAESVARAGGKGKGIDLNAGAAMEELDLLPRLEEPRVISPRPVRPVGSSIFVEKFAGGDLGWPAMAPKAAEEVEEMAEAEDVPMIVSDSSNRVRMCNAAYKEMVGQPECGWLEDCAAGRKGGAWRRIGGEISLHFSGSRVQMGMHGFSCRVKIEWESEGVKKSVNAYCEGLKLGCQSKDYQFLWRFNAIN